MKRITHSLPFKKQKVYSVTGLLMKRDYIDTYADNSFDF